MFLMNETHATNKGESLFEMEKTGTHIVTMEMTDKMTEPQIVAHVHHHFDPEAAKRGT